MDNSKSRFGKFGQDEAGGSTTSRDDIYWKPRCSHSTISPCNGSALNFRRCAHMYGHEPYNHRAARGTDHVGDDRSCRSAADVRLEGTGRWVTHEDSGSALPRGMIAMHIPLGDGGDANGMAEDQRRRSPRIDDATVARWRERFEAGATFREIAAEAEVDLATVRRHLGKTGRRTGPREMPLDRDYVAQVFAEEGSIAATARRLGVNRSVVRARLD
ncbi:hypothetical protein OG921_04740 [Aldersonia sp. NBC_00410]|uniref:hypothetical protein n=1 Tax=Aldersonia sp. NBC_00410 TaxID=2975954 RepID=UPI002256C5A3|nr:hypothetical protein [Aldersonia sp. NBC_00410]MCX5042479.1 hypothetical protein [Aldersonia sp. NBC_00410]